MWETPVSLTKHNQRPIHGNVMSKLTGPLDVSFINRTFFRDVDPPEINYGKCFIWAYIAFHLYEDVELWSFGNHAFVKYDGKFYDSERPNGEEDWSDLPATNWGKGCGCSICKNPAKKVSEVSFKSSKHWGGQAKRFHVTWEGLRMKVQRAIEDHESQMGNNLDGAGPALVHSTD